MARVHCKEQGVMGRTPFQRVFTRSIIFQAGFNPGFINSWPKSAFRIAPPTIVAQTDSSLLPRTLVSAWQTLQAPLADTVPGIAHSLGIPHAGMNAKLLWARSDACLAGPTVAAVLSVCPDGAPPYRSAVPRTNLSWRASRRYRRERLHVFREARDTFDRNTTCLSVPIAMTLRSNDSAQCLCMTFFILGHAQAEARQGHTEGGMSAQACAPVDVCRCREIR